VIDAALAEKAEVTLKALPDANVCIRLKAIISSAHYPINLVSDVFGTNRTTLWRWIKRFASKGISGLLA
jgi:Homeodomain-like domain